MMYDAALQTDAAETKGFLAQLAVQDGIAVTEIDRLRQRLCASTKRAFWLRQRLVSTTQAKSSADQVCHIPVLLLPE